MCMLQCNRNIFRVTCSLNVARDLHSKYIHGGFPAGKASMGCRFPHGGVSICGKVPGSLKQLDAFSFPIFFLISTLRHRLCNLSEDVWWSGNLNLDLCNPSWVSQGTVVLVKCYSRFLQSSFSGARLAYQKVATWSLDLAYTIWPCLWKCKWEICAYQTVSIKNKKGGERAYLPFIVKKTLQVSLLLPGIMWADFSWNTAVSAK